MIAVFTRTQKDFESMNFHPKKEFKRIKTVLDIKGVRFSSIVKLMYWFEGGENICQAYDELVKRQPELLKR